MTAATGPSATVDVSRESRVSRIGPRADAADLRVPPPRPFRVAILVEGSGPRLAAARAAVWGAGAEVALVLRGDARATIVERAVALREAAPAMILVAAGGDVAMLVDLAEAVRLACGSLGPAPAVLVAGASADRDRLAPSLRGCAVSSVPELTTPAGREAVIARIRADRRDDGATVLRDEAVEAAARALAAGMGKTTLVVDVTGGTTSLAHATAAGERASIHVGAGVGAAADRIVARAGLDRVRRWIPRAIDGPALLERVFNRARWPGAVAATPLTLAIEMALAREAIAIALAEAERASVPPARLRAPELIVATGEIARLPRPAQTVLAVLDALAPVTTCLIAREREDALVAAGAVASRAAADVGGAIELLAVATPLPPGRPVSVRVADRNGVVEERAGRGAFFLVPTTGAVELTLPAATAPLRTAPLALGVVVDARGRPLELPARDAERLPAMARWHAALDALPPEVA